MIKKTFTSAAVWTTWGWRKGCSPRVHPPTRFHRLLARNCSHPRARLARSSCWALALTKVWAHADRRLRWFLLFWNVGLALTFAMMLVKGSLQVQAELADSPMIAGMSGLGHMILTGSFVLFFLILRRSLHAKTGSEPVPHAEAPLA